MEENKRDIFTRKWIIEHAQTILAQYSEGITIRQLHYRLVAIGMINDINHNKPVVKAMTEARWDGIIDMDAFIDRERELYGRTEAEEKDLDEQVERAKEQVKAWMKSYHLERWSNQKNFIEIWIEKKALQGVFEMPCIRNCIGLFPCKGYPSLTKLNEASERFQEAIDNGQTVTILYWGDYDPSGEDIPRSVKVNIERLDCDINIERRALTPEQIQNLHLPGVPPKRTDTRTRNWGGDAVVELDAVEPKMLQKMCEDAIAEYFDEDLYEELQEKETEERKKYQEELKEFVINLGDKKSKE